MVSPKVKEILANNQKRVKFINSGVRCWSKTDIPDCDHPYRITQDGVDILSMYMKKDNPRFLDVCYDDMVKQIWKK